MSSATAVSPFVNCCWPRRQTPPVHLAYILSLLNWPKPSIKDYTKHVRLVTQSGHYESMKTSGSLILHSSAMYVEAWHLGAKLQLLLILG